MQKQLVNSQYVRELLEVTEDQNEFDLVTQLFQRLMLSRDEFLKASLDWIEKDNSQLSFQLHKLKNQFANLGCEAVSQMLEDMYQQSRQHHPEKVREMLPALRDLSDQTFDELRLELKH